MAGASACSREIPIVNVLKPNSAYGTDWSTGVRGYEQGESLAADAFGTAAGDRVTGTDAIDLRSVQGGAVTVTDQNQNSAQFKVNTVNHVLTYGDIVMGCDYGK